MPRGKKFGAFGGVFTPSVLTILGVIMYLRLGYVVGHAGWIGTIFIIMIAHVISITTGLSVSSVATDRKVKAGGLYYMLSRSLGLPIGGSIGITLFVGTALSISMYIVGFSESFNGALGLNDSMQQTVVAEISKNDRISQALTAEVKEDSTGSLASALLTQISFAQYVNDSLSLNESIKLALEEADFAKQAIQQVDVLENGQLSDSVRSVDYKLGQISIILTKSIKSEVDRSVMNWLRITGSLTLFLIATIALISTSLAIKTQYYIMAAIALSLVSIIGGMMFFPIPEFEITQLQPFRDADLSDNYAVIFGIFFPAVTGFTAGVAMSGDLKDPKKAIPVGTIAAIAVGLIVYIGLGLLLSLKIDPQVLRDEENIFTKLTFLVRSGWMPDGWNGPYLLNAGIWGATLSSALGGILGGPRILQAMSWDKITPKMFGVGVGASNEPRNALILTFLIAEGGVLIGDLNAIAPIVSMFYLAAYGFINLTSALESWTGSDFRPSFKIPRFISVLGALATFTVMSQISLGAMIGSFLIIGLLFFYLTKKQINLGFTDIWQGVWAELVRIGLFNIDKKSRAKDKKNWRPNILLFSGDKGRRPYLVDFGKSVVGRLGVVSSFELIETEEMEQPLTRADQTVDTGSGFTGMFFRKYQCRNIYEGIQTITETYGFSGIEPNTVMMGWARYSKSPVDFTKLIGRFHKMDYNILVMDYDQRVGFGANETIDIWWEGKGGNVAFALTMARFLTADDAWIKAKVRLFIMIDKTQVNSTEVYQTMEDELEELRIYAEVKIVDNQHGEKSLYSAIEIESNRADLIFVELPSIEAGYESDFFAKTDKLCKEIGTVVLYHSSSRFEQIDIGLNLGFPKLEQPGLEVSVPTEKEIRELILPKKPELDAQLSRLYDHMVKSIQIYGENYLLPIAREHTLLVESTKDLLKVTLAKIQALQDAGTEVDSLEWKEIPKAGFEDAEKLLKNFSENKIKTQSKALFKGIQELNRKMRKLVRSFPRSIPIVYELNELNGKDKSLKRLNLWQRTRAKRFKKPVTYNYRFRAFSLRWLRQFGLETARDLARNFNDESVGFNEEFQQILRRFGAIMQQLVDKNAQHSVELVNIIEEAEKVYILADTLIEREQVRFERYIQFLLETIHRNLQNAITDIENLNFKPNSRKGFGLVDKLQDVREEILDTPQVWAQNQMLFTDMFWLDLMLQEFQSKLRLVVLDLKSEFKQSLQDTILLELKKMIIGFSNYLEGNGDEENLPKNGVEYAPQQFQYRQAMLDFLGDLEWLMGDMPSEIEVLSEHAIQHPKTGEVTELESINISPNVIINYTVQNYFTEQVISEMGELDHKVMEANEVIRDIERVLAVSLKNISGESRTEELNLLIKSELDRLKVVYDGLLNQQDEVVKLIDKHISDVTERLTTYGLVKEAVNIDSFLLTKTRQRVFSIFSKIWEKTSEEFFQTLTDLRYRKSESLAQAKKLPATNLEENIADRVLSLVEQVSPKKEVLEVLPFYYKQLFVKEQSSSLELWYNREKELGLAEHAIRRHKQGVSGAILVTGTPDSGKSFLSEKIAQQFFDEKLVHVIHPPVNQNPDLKTFRMVMNQSFGVKANYRLDTLFNKMEEGTVLVFHDIELWWERSDKGTEVIERLTSLIDDFSNKCVFILNTNQYTMHFFKRLGLLKGSYLQVIDCESFGAKDIKEVILLRHRSSHLKFRLEDVIESDLSDWTLAGLFTKHYKYSKGNIGVALQAWLANVAGANKSELEIVPPNKLDVEVLEELPMEWLILLFQFILHKKMTLSKIVRVMKESRSTLEHDIKSMLRAGLLIEQNGVFEINRYLSPHLLETLEKKDML